VFDDKFEIPWEVDDFWAKFKSDVLPKVKSGSSVTLETRLSESPEIRKGIADRAREQLVKAGAREPSVQVLSAYKQGYLWLTEQVIPLFYDRDANGIPRQWIQRVRRAMVTLVPKYNTWRMVEEYARKYYGAQ